MAGSTSKFTFFRAPQNLGSYAELMADTFIRILFLAAIAVLPLMQFYVWNHAVYAAGLLAYYILVAVELFGSPAFLPKAIVISKKRERIKAIAFVSLGSVALVAVFPYLGTTDEIGRPILIVYLVSPLLFAMILCLNRKATPNNKNEE